MLRWRPMRWSTPAHALACVAMLAGACKREARRTQSNEPARVAAGSEGSSQAVAPRTSAGPAVASPSGAASATTSASAARELGVSAPVFVVTEEAALASELVSGPSVGSVDALAEIDGVLFAGAALAGDHSGGGVFASDDGGKHFRRTSAGLPRIEARRAVGPDRAAPHGVYAPIASLAADGDVLLVGTREHQIYRSEDRGRSWGATTGLMPASGNGEYADRITTIVCDGTQSYALSGHGTFVSSDHGLSWSLDAAATGQTTAIAADGHLLARARGGEVIVSSAGKTLGTSTLPSVDGLAIRNGVIYAASLAPPDHVYESRDRGKTFRPLPSLFGAEQHGPLAVYGFGLPPTAASYARPFGYSLWTGRSALAMKSGLVAIAGEDGVFTTDDHGATYTRSKSGLTAAALSPVVATSQDLLAGAGKVGFYRGPLDGSDFRGQGYGGSEVRSLAAQGNEALAGDDQGRLFKWNGDARTWAQVELPPATPAGPTEAIGWHGQHQLVVRGGILVSRDGGVHFADLRAGFPPVPSPVPEGGTEYKIACADVSATAVFVCGSSGLWRASDAADWREIRLGRSASLVKAVAVDSERVFAATASAVYVSRDDGKTFEVVGRPGPGLLIASLGATDGELLVIANREDRSTGAFQLFLSRDGGKTWRTSSPSIDQLPRSAPTHGPTGWYFGLESDGIWHLATSPKVRESSGD